MRYSRALIWNCWLLCPPMRIRAIVTEFPIRISTESATPSPSFSNFDTVADMPIGKIGDTSGKGADYKAGSVNIDAATSNSGSKAVTGYQKTTSAHSYGAGALNIEATTNVPKVKENLGVAKSELAGTSQYGAGAVLVEGAINAPKIKHESLGQVDKTKENVFEKK